MNLIFQDAQDAAGMHSECSECELILFADAGMLGDDSYESLMDFAL